jgi:hypothetical protein
VNNIENIILSYTEKYGEWQEMLGDKFPEFLLRILASDLDKAQSQTEFLKKAYLTNQKELHDCSRR